LFIKNDLNDLINNPTDENNLTIAIVYIIFIIVGILEAIIIIRNI